MTRRKILCIEGGGLKGVYAAQILADLEEDLQDDETKSNHIADYFDLISGTSTGGIIALGLAMRIPAKTILKLYFEKAESIFPTRWLPNRFIKKTTFAALGKSLYTSEPLITELRNTFGVNPLGSSRSRLVIPAFFLDDRKVILFKTRHHELFQEDFKLPMWEIAAATAAAPMFLDKHQFEDERSFSDGGLWANNPSAVAIAEAVEYCGWSAHDIDLLSISGVREVFPPGAEKNAIKLVGLLMDAQSKGAVALAKTLLGATEAQRPGVGTFTELSHTATHGEFGLDDANSVGRLAAIAKDHKRSEQPHLSGPY